MTVTDLLAALKPAGYVHVWVRNFSGDGSFTSLRLHKTELIEVLKKLPRDATVTPFTVQDQSYTNPYGNRVVAQNVFLWPEDPR